MVVVAAVAAAVASTNVTVDIVAFVDVVAGGTTKLDCTNWLNWWHS